MSLDKISLDEIYKKLSEPKRFGPGYWTYLHQLSLDSETDEDIDFCIKTIFKILIYITCGECSEESNEFITVEKINSYKNWKDSSGRRRGMFKLTVDWHNHANKRTGVKEMSYETALQIWTGVKEGGCKQGCGYSGGILSLEEGISESSRTSPQSNFSFGRSSSFLPKSSTKSYSAPHLSPTSTFPVSSQSSREIREEKPSSIFSSSFFTTGRESEPSFSPERGYKLETPQQISGMSSEESSEDEGEIIEETIEINGRRYVIPIKTGQQPTIVKSKQPASIRTGQVIFGQK